MSEVKQLTEAEAAELEKRTKLVGYIQDAVDYMSQITDLKSDIDNLGDIVKEELGVGKGEFKSFVEIAYSRQTLLAKIKKMQLKVEEFDKLTKI